MFTMNGQRFESVKIARRVAIDGWELAEERCNWLVRYAPQPYQDPDTGEWWVWEDPELPIRECGAEVAIMPNGDRWECAAGHEHTSMELRHSEGWDYAEDEDEARRMIAAGVEPRF